MCEAGTGSTPSATHASPDPRRPRPIKSQHSPFDNSPLAVHIGMMTTPRCLSLLFLFACAKENPGAYTYYPTCEPDGDPVALTVEATWSASVGALVAENCTGCHVEGGIAPFVLTDYEAAKPMASAMAAAAEARRMPPWLPSSCGDCQTYEHSRALSEEEIAILVKWADDGAPEGSPATFEPADPAALESEDAVLDPGEAYTPSAEPSDTYRCFVVDSPVSADAYVTGYEVHPGESSVVHHVIVYAPETDEAADQLDALDAADAGIGYECFGGAGVSATPLALWAPGGGATNFPTGTGLSVFAGRKLVIQVHYNTQHGTAPDQTTVSLQLSNDVDRPAQFTRLSNNDLELPPGEVTTVTMDAVAPNKENALIWGIAPHMHETGVSLQLTSTHDGDETCLVDVPEFDFHWQGLFLYESPVLVQPGSDLLLTCVFDTSGRTEVTTFGEATSDEMCLVFAYTTAE